MADNTSKFIIHGGNPLSGNIKVSGSKNAATKLLVASMLSDKKSMFFNSPNKISDLTINKDVCEALGSKINISGDTLTVHTEKFTTSHIPEQLGNRTRIAILMAGPLLNRTGKAEIPIPGGCMIGSRPVNFHIDALEMLGANVEVKNDYYYLSTDGLKGANIHLDYPSVGATENVIIASTLAKGKTILTNAAVEPEIIDLIKYLQKMGAIIEISTDRRIMIEGVDRLEGAEHTVIPDRNQVASFACAGLASKGDVFVENAIQEDLISFLNNVRRIGGKFDVKNHGIRFFYDGPFKPISLETNVHPGFMTDWQQPFVILMTQANGTSIVHETVYEKRFGYVNELKKMGADIEINNKCMGNTPCRFLNSDYLHSAIINGPTELHGAEIDIPDLRAGFSYLVAGIIAKGETVINGAAFIDRGYEDIDLKFKSIGADIKRV